MGALAIPIAIAVATAASAAAAGYSAYSSAEQSKAQANIADQQEDTARAAAAQAEVQQRRQLMQVIASQDALRAARGSSLTSGTALSIYGDTTEQGEEDIRTTRLNYLSQADQYSMTAAARRSAATDSNVGGYLSIGGTLAGGGARAYSAYRTG